MEIRKDFELSGNENMTHQNLFDATHSVLRGKFVALNR